VLEFVPVLVNVLVAELVEVVVIVPELKAVLVVLLVSVAVELALKVGSSFLWSAPQPTRAGIVTVRRPSSLRPIQPKTALNFGKEFENGNAQVAKKELQEYFRNSFINSTPLSG
jgi:hypothetical protein